MSERNAHTSAGLKSECQELSRRIETDLVEQGVKLFPATKTGERARELWRQIKPDLLHGRAIEITRSALRLDLHREELKRARALLEEMSLIKPRSEGRYVLGDVGPCGAIDELIRDEFLNLKVLESLVILLASMGNNAKARQQRQKKEHQVISRIRRSRRCILGHQRVRVSEIMKERSR